MFYLMVRVFCRGYRQGDKTEQVNRCAREETRQDRQQESKTLNNILVWCSWEGLFRHDMVSRFQVSELELRIHVKGQEADAKIQ